MEQSVLKITNPLWLGNIGPRINELARRVDIDGIPYEGLYSYFAQSVQFGGDNSELFVAFEDGQPMAFAHWYVRGIPSVGKVFLDFIYSWGRDKRYAAMLIDEFLKFGKRHRAPVYEGISVNETTFRLFQKAFVLRGLDVKRSTQITSTARFKPLVKETRDENIPEDSNKPKDQ